MSPQSENSVLTTEADGVPFKFTNDVDIAQNGIIYFTDASDKFAQKEYRDSALENRSDGRLLSYNPKTQETKVLINNLYFANGVAISSDKSFILVNETWEYRVRKYWLKGERAGNNKIS